MQIGYLLHAQPAEFGTTHGAGHVVTGTIIQFNYESSTPRAWFHVLAVDQTLAIACNNWEQPIIRSPSLPCHVAGKVRVPDLLTVIAEFCFAFLPFASELRQLAQPAAITA